MDRPSSRHSRTARVVVGRSSAGQPRTYRLSPAPAQQAAYRRLAVAILGLDVASLADELLSSRRTVRRAA